MARHVPSAGGTIFMQDTVNLDLRRLLGKLILPSVAVTDIKV
jgi:hypothetical protein